MPELVTSADGTRIAFERRGAGPAIILIGGILSDHGWVAPLAEALSDRFTTIAVDRRDRGDSGNGTDYAVAREVEDIAALIGVAGDQSAHHQDQRPPALASPLSAVRPDGYRTEVTNCAYPAEPSRLQHCSLPTANLGTGLLG